MWALLRVRPTPLLPLPPLGNSRPKDPTHEGGREGFATGNCLSFFSLSNLHLSTHTSSHLLISPSLPPPENGSKINTRGVSMFKTTREVGEKQRRTTEMGGDRDGNFGSRSGGRKTLETSARDGARAQKHGAERANSDNIDTKTNIQHEHSV